jgi:hypothetical protein
MIGHIDVFLSLWRRFLESGPFETVGHAAGRSFQWATSERICAGSSSVWVRVVR